MMYRLQWGQTTPKIRGQILLGHDPDAPMTIHIPSKGIPRFIRLSQYVKER